MYDAHGTGNGWRRETTVEEKLVLVYIILMHPFPIYYGFHSRDEIGAKDNDYQSTSNHSTSLVAFK